MTKEHDSKLPWMEKVAMFSINPDAATRDDIARMAAELSAIHATEIIKE